MSGAAFYAGYPADNEPPSTPGLAVEPLPSDEPQPRRCPGASAAYRCPQCGRTLLASSGVVNGPRLGFPLETADGNRRVCRGCGVAVRLVCTSCGGQFRQQDHQQYHQHIAGSGGAPSFMEVEAEPAEGGDQDSTPPASRGDLDARLVPTPAHPSAVMFVAWALQSAAAAPPPALPPALLRRIFGYAGAARGPPWPATASLDAPYAPFAPFLQLVAQKEYGAADQWLYRFTCSHCRLHSSPPSPLWGATLHGPTVPGTVQPEVELVTIYFAAKAESRVRGVPGLGPAMDRDNALTLRLAQCDSLRGGVVLHLLKGACPSDGFALSAEEEERHMHVTLMQLLLFPNLKAIRVCSVRGFRFLLRHLCCLEMTPGLSRNHLGTRFDVQLRNSPWGAAWVSPPTLWGFFHPLRFRRHPAGTSRRAGVERADAFHRAEFGRYLRRCHPHLLCPPPADPHAAPAALQQFKAVASRLGTPKAVWSRPSGPPVPQPAAVEDGEDAFDPLEDDALYYDWYLPARALRASGDGDEEQGMASLSLHTLQPAAVQVSNQLLWASSAGDLVAVDAALAAGAQVEVRDDAGLTALMLAARAGHAVVVERLLAAGANPNCTANVPAVDGQGTVSGYTALMGAVQERQEPVVLALLRHPFTSVNSATSMGGTALHDAAWAGDLRIAQLLLAAQADPSTRTLNGISPIAVAEGQGNTALSYTTRTCR